MNISKLYEDYKSASQSDNIAPLSKRMFVATFWRIFDLPKFERVVLKRINQMCEESLPPHDFEKWMEVKEAIQKTRKELNK